MWLAAGAADGVRTAADIVSGLLVWGCSPSAYGTGLSRDPIAGSQRLRDALDDDVLDVVVLRVTPEDGPWFEADGRRFWPPAGDAVVISHCSGSRLLPPHDPHGFADVGRARIEFRR